MLAQRLVGQTPGQFGRKQGEKSADENICSAYAGFQADEARDLATSSSAASSGAHDGIMVVQPIVGLMRRGPESKSGEFRRISGRQADENKIKYLSSLCQFPGR